MPFARDLTECPSVLMIDVPMTSRPSISCDEHATARNASPACAMLLVLALCGGELRAETTPAGLWRTIDDATGRAKAIVRIVESDGALSGRIEHLFDEDRNVRCEKCRGHRKDQPVLG